jgi:hypothetical protein
MGLHRNCQSQHHTLTPLPSRGRGLAGCLLQRTGVLHSGSKPTQILACYEREAKGCHMIQMGPTMVVLLQDLGGMCHQMNMDELIDIQDNII